jgi:hypothetical protein
VFRLALAPERGVRLGAKAVERVPINPQRARRGVAFDLEIAKKFLYQFVPGRMDIR